MSDTPTSTPKTPAERIQELNDINKQIPLILSAASTAIRALTNSSLPPAPGSPTTLPQPTPTPATLTAHKTAFQDSTHTFFTLLTRITNALDDQARALETAGIIPATAARVVREVTAADLAAITGGKVDVGMAGERDSEAGVRNGGLGELDVGWLNARAGQGGAGVEGEVLGRVREILEGLVGEKKGDGKGEDWKMEDV